MPIWFQLIKLPVSLAVALSALAGYLIWLPRIDTTAVVILLSTFALAGGAAILNNYQDRHFDGLFTRTSWRAFPQNKVSPVFALFIAALMLMIGLTGLFLADRTGVACILGITSLILYNGLYSPLKKKTMWAILPGTLCGILPPLIGWAGAGGRMAHPQIWILMTAIGLWQLPHFWLLLLKYEKEQTQVSIPNMLKMFDRDQLKRILFVWVAAFISVILSFPVAGILNNTWTQWCMVICVLTIMLFFSCIIFSGHFSKYNHTLFRLLNISMGMILSLIIFDRLLYPGFSIGI